MYIRRIRVDPCPILAWLSSYLVSFIGCIGFIRFIGRIGRIGCIGYIG